MSFLCLSYVKNTPDENIRRHVFNSIFSSSKGRKKVTLPQFFLKNRRMRGRDTYVDDSLNATILTPSSQLSILLSHTDFTIYYFLLHSYPYNSFIISNFSVPLWVAFEPCIIRPWVERWWESTWENNAPWTTKTARIIWNFLHLLSALTGDSRHTSKHSLISNII